MITSKMYTGLGWNGLIGLVLAVLLLTACGGGGGGGKEPPPGGGGQVIGSNGGTKTSDDGKASVEIPPDALSEEKAITVAPASNPPNGNIGTAYEFGPSGTKFAKPVTITLKYNETDLAGTDESLLRLAVVDNDKWVVIAGSVSDKDENVVSGQTDHFSVYGILAVSDLGSCREAVFSLNVVAADEACKAELAADSGNPETNLFRSVTRIVRIAEEDTNGPDPSTFTDSWKEMLDRAEVSSGGRSIFAFTADFARDPNGEILIPFDTPNGVDTQTFLKNVVLPEIDGALANLAEIGPGFTMTITASEARSDTSVEVDFGDIKLYEAGLHAARAAILASLSYDVNIGVSDAEEIAAKSEAGTLNIQAELNARPNLLTLTSGADLFLPQAESAVKAGIDAYMAASDFVRSETDDQRNDFFIFPDPDDDPFTQAEDVQDEAAFRALLIDIKNSLEGPTVIGGESVHLGPLFGTPFANLRSLAPQFSFDPITKINGIVNFPDPTFNGILPNGQNVVADFLAPEIGTDWDGNIQDDGSTEIRIRNCGLATEPPLTITELTLTGDSEFSFDPKPNLPVSLKGGVRVGSESGPCGNEGGEELVVPIKFAPTGSGPFSAALTIHSNDPDHPTKTEFLSGFVPFQ